MGVPSRGRRDELDCHLCNELDDGEILQRCPGPTFWRAAVGNGRADLSIRPSWVCIDGDVLAHPVLDVSAEDFSEDMRHSILPQVRIRPAFRRVFLALVFLFAPAFMLLILIWRSCFGLTLHPVDDVHS